MMGTIEQSELAATSVADLLQRFKDNPAEQLTISQFLRLKEAMHSSGLVLDFDFNTVGEFVQYLQSEVAKFTDQNAVLKEFYLNGLLGCKTKLSQCLAEHSDEIKGFLNDLNEQQFSAFISFTKYLMVYHQVEHLSEVIDPKAFGQECLAELMVKAIDYLMNQAIDDTLEQGLQSAVELTNVLRSFQGQGFILSNLSEAYKSIFQLSRLLVQDYIEPILTFLLSNKVPIDREWLVGATLLSPWDVLNDERCFIQLLREHNLYYSYESNLVEMIYTRCYRFADKLDPAHLNRRHASFKSKGLELSPLHIAVLHSSDCSELFDLSLDTVVGLGMTTQLVPDEDQGTLVYRENLLHLAITKRRFDVARKILVHCQRQSVDLIHGRNSLGQTPLHYLASLCSSGELDKDLMGQMIDCRPDLMVKDVHGKNLVHVFIEHAPEYLPQLLYYGHSAYAYVATRFRSMVLAVAEAYKTSLVGDGDQDFIQKLSEQSIDLLSEQCIEQAKAVFDLCKEECFDKKTPLALKIMAHMKVTEDGELMALLSLRNVTSLSHELAFKESLWSPAYFANWCSAWRTHSPQLKVNFFDVLPPALIGAATRTLSLPDMMQLQRLCKKARQVTDQCLYPQSLLDQINQRFPESNIKRELVAKQAELVAQGRGTPKDQILALLEVVHPEDFRDTPDDYYRFLAIVMNRSFSNLVGGDWWHQYAYRSPDYVERMVEDLFFIAAAMGRRHHFMALLRACNGFGISSSRVTWVLASTGQLGLLWGLSNIETVIKHVEVPSNIAALQDKVNWNGEPDVIGMISAFGDQQDQSDYDLLPRERVEIGGFVGRKFYKQIIRVASESPLIASMQNNQRQVAMFLAGLAAVNPSYEDILFAKRSGDHQLYERLISKVPADSPTRIKLLASGIIKGNLGRDEAYQLIARLLPKFQEALSRAVSAYMRNKTIHSTILPVSWLRYTLLTHLQHTLKHDALARSIGNSIIQDMYTGTDTDTERLCESIHDIIHSEIFTNKEVRGTDLMRFIIEAIHQDPELCESINLRQIEGGAASHDTIFNDHLPKIEIKMPPSCAPKQGEKPSIAYRNFYRAYLKATLALWKDIVKNTPRAEL